MTARPRDVRIVRKARGIRRVGGEEDGCVVGCAACGAPDRGRLLDVQASEPWVAETPQGRSIVGAIFPAPTISSPIT